VLTIAVADALLKDRNHKESILSWARKYPWAGYGRNFKNWMYAQEQVAYNSWGNGSAMRVCPVAYVFDDLSEVMDEARRTAMPTHNHPEGIKGAEAIATAVFLARTGQDKHQIRMFIQEEFGYDLSRKIEDIRSHYKFDVSCQGSVPEAIIAFLDSIDYESAIRLAV
jgi:ADP-ribosylglycohydrolase